MDPSMVEQSSPMLHPSSSKHHPPVHHHHIHDPFKHNTLSHAFLPEPPRRHSRSQECRFSDPSLAIHALSHISYMSRPVLSVLTMRRGHQSLVVARRIPHTPLYCSLA
ncbi:hypothetical protein EJ05DRAFT_42131 [Pseudovirgaria hyperparasitica]|uniref:Uncharacterized protein n=1 Tax=Pseudovirgaria hyperparasitica TaxID=470096 RepID=A0A6A6WN19_9PEZI|nr:uncharacterized protein EJ05DRAFT_42131 [Pseudovirgaria hyperparasitica]KAF2763523.1 hypothetical protein EJ05DRAFT_42131 [Pseudovirgaria hyperparasitica]